MFSVVVWAMLYLYTTKHRFCNCQLPAIVYTVELSVVLIRTRKTPRKGMDDVVLIVVYIYIYIYIIRVA